MPSKTTNDTKQVKRNCRQCNGILQLKKATGSMWFGSCATCKRTYALVKHQASLEVHKRAS